MQTSKDPLVSIIIPSYNHESFIEDSIQSVIKQSYKNIELIIIDDGSKDGSVKKIEALVNLCQNRFVRFEFRSRNNKGLSSTLNEALEWCEGEYFSCIASDDMLLPAKTSIQVDFLNSNPDILAVFGGVNIIDNNNVIIDKIKGTGKAYNFKDVILQDAVVLAPTQMIRLSEVRKVGGFKADLAIEDWYMWLKLSEVGKLYCMNEYLSLYRNHDSNITKQTNNMYYSRIEVLRHFDSSKFYKDAMKKVDWLRHYELLMHVGQDKQYHFAKMMLINPYNTIKLSMRKLIKISKKRFNI